MSATPDIPRPGARAKVRPRILLVTPLKITTGPYSGGEQRLLLIERALRALGDVTLHLITPDDSTLKPNVRGDVPVGLKMEAANRAASSHPALRRHRPSPAHVRAFQAARPESYDIVFLHRLQSCWWTGWTDPRRTIIDLDDLCSKGCQISMAQASGLQRWERWLRFQRMRWTERRALHAFRFALVCSEEDRLYLRHPNARLLANAYWPHPAMDAEPAPDPPGSLLFVGTLLWAANVEAVRWFTLQVLPLIRRELPEAGFTIVGRSPPLSPPPPRWSDWAQQPGVRVIGSVDDVAPHLAAAKVSVCPLLFGRGTRIKIIESLAFGRPVVSTTIGAYGLPLGENEGLLRCDQPETMAQACVALLRDAPRRRSLGLSGRTAVRERFGPASMETGLGGLIDMIMQEQGPANAGV